MMDEHAEGRPTAYVLGEMTADERAAFELELAASPELRAEVEELREMASLLGREMATERASLPPEVRARIEAAAAEKSASQAAARGAAADIDEKNASDGATRAPVANDVVDGGGVGEAEAMRKGSDPRPVGAPDAPAARVLALPIKRPLLRRPGFWLAATALAAAVPALWLTTSLRPSAEEAPSTAYGTAKPAATAASTTRAMAEEPMRGRRNQQLAAGPMPSSGTKGSNGLVGGVGAAGAGNTEPMSGHRLFARSPPDPSASGNRFEEIIENPFLTPTTDPLSTFSIDVDTASYALARTFLLRGSLPPVGSVRIEEMINYFGYDYAEPEGDVPFRVQVDLGVAPWAQTHRLVRVGLKGKTVKMSQMDGVNLVFLVDTSGSMEQPNKLPLLKQGFRMLVDKLGPNDHVAIVAYAGSAGLVLPSTAVSERGAVLGALDRLSSGGSTNGGAGIDLAYKVAAQAFRKGGVNRVILATDGDFNVGTTDQGQLVQLIQEKAKTGVFLSVLGFGMGNFNDSLLEKIADKGNGQYAYIDNEVEAKRTLVDGLGSLTTIAKDVKIQIELNPAEVAGYRLIGYENRVMAAADFNNDKKDAGELGSGRTVTALYEVILKGGAVPAGDALKYQRPAPGAAPAGGAASTGTPGELLTVKLRYKEPDGSESKLIEEVLPARDASLAAMSADFKFAAAVASFGMLLRGSKHAGDATFASVESLAEGGAGDDAKRREFLDLVRRARSAPKPGAAAPRPRCDPADPLCSE